MSEGASVVQQPCRFTSRWAGERASEWVEMVCVRVVTASPRTARVVKKLTASRTAQVRLRTTLVETARTGDLSVGDIPPHSAPDLPVRLAQSHSARASVVR